MFLSSARERERREDTYPAGAPRVADDPVVRAVLGAVADDGDTVVEAAAAALGLVVDARAVELEAVLAGVDADADDGLCGGCQGGVFRAEPDRCATTAHLSDAAVGVDISGSGVADAAAVDRSLMITFGT